MNKSTIAHIFSDHRKDVYGLSYYYLRHQQDSMDAVMEVFEAFIKYSGRDQISNVRAWLLETARRISLSKIRKRKKLPELVGDKNNDPTFMESDKNEHILYEKRIEDMLVAVKDLKNEQQWCIELFYLHDMSYQEVANRLDMPEKSVKSHIQNAKRNLKIKLSLN